MRGVRNQEGIDPENTDQQEEKTEEKKGRKKGFKLGKETIIPYDGKENLPKETLDSKGQVVKQGASRHFVAREGNVYKLIRVYRAKGIKHSLVRMLKPRVKERVQDRILFNQLKSFNIPGAK